MTTRYISVVFLGVATTLAIAAASAQSPPAQSQAGASARASGQGAVGVDRSGAARSEAGVFTAATRSRANPGTQGDLPRARLHEGGDSAGEPEERPEERVARG